MNSIKKMYQSMVSFISDFSWHLVLMAVLILTLLFFLICFISVMASDIDAWWAIKIPIRVIESLFGPLKKNDLLTFLGFSMGGVLLAIQAVISNRRVAAMENTAKAQASAAEQQAKANQNFEQGQRQERLKNAIDHLGATSDSVRLGGVYELFHLAEDTREWRKTVLDILCAHIRRTTCEKEYQDKFQEQPSEEIQSMLTLLFVQQHTLFKGHRANLEGTWLTGANLRGARLQGAKLINTRLQRAHLDDAQLQGAKLSHAKLQGAWFSNASLLGAKLEHALMQLTRLEGAKLQGAFLPNANLQVAKLFDAKLQGAILAGTQLQGAFLENALFQGVNCLSNSKSFKENIENRVGQKPEFLAFSSPIFSGSIGSRETVEMFTEGLPAHFVELLWGGLIEDVGKPASYEPPEDSSVIIEPPYTQKDAERWIAEYDEAVPVVPGDVNN